MEIVVRGASAPDTTGGRVRGITDPGPSALLAAVAANGPDPDHVLYLVPRNTVAGAREQAHVLLARGRHAGVCVLDSDHHPLTLMITAAILDDLARKGVWSNPGHAVQIARQVLAGSRSLVWNPRLTGVRQPRPKAGRRWSSVLPGRSYLTLIGDDTIRRMPARLEIGGHETLYVGVEPPPALAAALSGLRINRVDLQTRAGSPYGGRGAVELTTMLPVWPSAPTGQPCASCGAFQVGDWCAFCNHHPYRPDTHDRWLVGNQTGFARV